MVWLMLHMWVALAAAFLIGMLVHRWIFGGGGGLSAEDVSAELASVRTRHQEAEAERARLRAKVLELTHQLDEARRETRSVKAELHATSLKDGGAPSVAPRDEPEPEPDPEPELEPVRAAPPEPDPEPQASTPTIVAPDPVSEADTEPEPPALSEPAARPGPIVERAALEETAPSAARPTFLAAPDRGAPDDLTKIKGVGAKLEKTLNDLGVYYFAQIAAWTDEQVAEVDEHLQFPGRIERDDWRSQARVLAEVGGGASA